MDLVENTAIERQIQSVTEKDLACGITKAKTLTTIDEIRITPDKLRIVKSVYLSSLAFAEGAEPIKKEVQFIEVTDVQLKSLFDEVKTIITGG